MGSRSTSLLVGLALVACARTEGVAPAPAPDVEAAPEVEAPVSVVSPPATSCAQDLMRVYAIDVTPEPRICEALAQAIAPLSPEHREMVKGLVIVRGARGPCADACPDLATALVSDGALAFYRNVHRELHVLDAALEGPRWRGGRPTPEALRGLYAALDLPDWRALVERVRALPGSALPPDPPEGEPAVLDAIVRRGGPTLLGGEVPLADLLRHELGHAILDALEPAPGLIGMWTTLSRWTDHHGRPADGFATGVWTGERPAVAVRLVLGMARGPSYTRRARGFRRATPRSIRWRTSPSRYGWRTPIPSRSGARPPPSCWSCRRARSTSPPPRCARSWSPGRRAARAARRPEPGEPYAARSRGRARARGRGAAGAGQSAPDHAAARGAPRARRHAGRPALPGRGRTARAAPLGRRARARPGPDTTPVNA